MTFLQIFGSIIKTLEKERVDYMIVGSVASMVYGEPRLTRDMDVVVQLPPAVAKNFHQIFPINEFYCPPIEILTDAVLNSGQFNLIHHESGLKIDFVVLKKTPHALTEFQRRRKIALFENFEVFLASPEDVILKKLQYFKEGKSEKHLNDIRAILANQDLDIEYLDYWVNELSVRQEWDSAKR